MRYVAIRKSKHSQMKIAFFLVVEGLGMVHFSLVSHSHGAVMFLGIIRFKVHRGGVSYVCLPFTFPLDQPSALLTSGTPLDLPLHPLNHSGHHPLHHDSSISLPTPLPLASLLSNPHTFHQSCKGLVCSYPRILF